MPQYGPSEVAGMPDPGFMQQLRIAQGLRSSVSNNPLAFPTVRVQSGKGDAEIMAAQSYIKDRWPYGVIELDSYGSYTFGDTVNLDTGAVALRGNRATVNAPGLTGGKVALYLNNVTNGDGGTGGQWPFVSEVSDLNMIGDPVAGRDAPSVGIRANTDQNLSSIRCLLRNVSTASFGTGISIGSRAYFLRGLNLDIHGSAVAILQESGAADYSEDVVFVGSAIYNSDVLIKALAGQKFKFYGTSFDYFGDGTGGRITGTENSLDLRAGASCELFGCHMEWNYGKFAGQTRSPVSLTGANTRFMMYGGFFGSTDTTRQPFYRAPIQSDNSSQAVVFRDVMIGNLGRSGQPTSDNELVCGSLANNTGTVGQISVSNLIPHGWLMTDFPATISNTSGGSWLRNGIDAPYSELFFRTNVTGTAVIANQASPDGPVVARNATGSMVKITGAGKVLITLQNTGQDARHMWGFFLNTSQAVGTVTVKQRDCTVVQAWDGTTGLTTKADTRNSYSSATKSITCGGTNQFEIVSWKDVHANPLWSPRMSGGQGVTIEIDTSAMTSGAIYLDDVAYGVAR